jgi:hypothetical protein
MLKAEAEQMELAMLDVVQTLQIEKVCDTL